MGVVAAEDDHDLIMALGRQALKERQAAQGWHDRKKVMAYSFVVFLNTK